jgi:uncharacterized membrane protein YhaH (DUF805 family)
MIHYYWKAFKNWKFSGRARRSEFWSFLALAIIFGFCLGVVDYLFGLVDDKTEYGLLSSLFALGNIIPQWAVTVRRLHDVGRSGWFFFSSFLLLPLFLLAPFLPFSISAPYLVGGVLFLMFGWGMLLFYFSVKDSQPGDNAYGPNPKLLTTTV